MITPQMPGVSVWIHPSQEPPTRKRPYKIYVQVKFGGLYCTTSRGLIPSTPTSECPLQPWQSGHPSPGRESRLHLVGRRWRWAHIQRRVEDRAVTPPTLNPLGPHQPKNDRTTYTQGRKTKDGTVGWKKRTGFSAAKRQNSCFLAIFM